MGHIVIFFRNTCGKKRDYLIGQCCLDYVYDCCIDVALNCSFMFLSINISKAGSQTKPCVCAQTFLFSLSDVGLLVILKRFRSITSFIS